MSVTKQQPVMIAMAVVTILILVVGGSLEASATETEGTVGVEKWDAQCTPGEREPITTTYAGTSRVEITWLGCSCHETAEQATAWLAEVAGYVSQGTLIDLEVPDRKHTMVFELEPGDEVPQVAYCFTEEQIVEYLKELEPREVDMRDGS